MLKDALDTDGMEMLDAEKPMTRRGSSTLVILVMPAILNTVRSTWVDDPLRPTSRTRTSDRSSSSIRLPLPDMLGIPA